MSKRMLTNLGAVILGLLVCGAVLWFKWSTQPGKPSKPSAARRVAEGEAKPSVKPTIKAPTATRPKATTTPKETTTPGPTPEPTPKPRLYPTVVWETLLQPLPTQVQAATAPAALQEAYFDLVRSQLKEIKQRIVPQVAQLYKRDPELVRHWADDPKLLLHQVFAEYDARRQDYAAGLEEPQQRLDTLLKEVETLITEAVFRFDYAVKEPKPSPLEQDAEFAKRMEEIEQILQGQ